MIIVIGESGVRSDLESILAVVDDLRLPCVLFFNQLDKDRTDWSATLKACQEALKKPLLPVTIPIGAERQLAGVIDLMPENRPSVRRRIIPRCNRDPFRRSEQSAMDSRKVLIEGVAEVDDRLLETYLSGAEVLSQDISDVLKRATHATTCIPTLCGSAIHTIGIAALLDAVAAYLPSPKERALQHPVIGTHTNGEAITKQATTSDPFSGFVFKTIIDPFVGRLSYVRVLSGTLEADGAFYNATKQIREKGGISLPSWGKNIPKPPARRPATLSPSES